MLATHEWTEGGRLDEHTDTVGERFVKDPFMLQVPRCVWPAGAPISS